MMSVVTCAICRAGPGVCKRYTQCTYMAYIGSDLCQATKTWSSSHKLFPSFKKKMKVKKYSWRCCKNNESITPGLMFDHKSHMYTSHRNSARETLNGCISLTLHQKLYLRQFIFSTEQCLSMVTFKIISDMYSWNWRSHPISENCPKICSS